jgi:hypothetical protein
MIKVLSNLLKILVIAASLSQVSHADIIASDNDFTFTWSAICGDCNSAMGEFDNTQNIEVSGDIVLKDYTPGEAFIINNENLVSFSYNGPSIHIDAFTLFNYNNPPEPRGPIWETGIFNIFGSIAADQSSFQLDFTHTIWEDDGLIYYEYPGAGAYPSAMDVHFGQDASWSFNITGHPWDFGVNASITPASNPINEVPEPTTLVIFALSLMGLASRKYKHNA